MKFDVELTDTFGGDANYDYCRRAWFVAKPEASRRELVRKAKALMGITGMPGNTRERGECIEFRPYGVCQVMYITWNNDDEI